MECKLIIDKDTYDRVFVESGQTVCIGNGVNCFGEILMNGGTLNNMGNIHNIQCLEKGGIIYNSGLFKCDEPKIAISGNLEINNLPGGTLFFQGFFTIYGNKGLDTLKINNYVDAKVIFGKELNVMDKCHLAINNGLFTPDYPNGRADFNLGDFNGIYASITFSNTMFGVFNIGGSFNLLSLDTYTNQINNSGWFNIANKFNLSSMNWSRTDISNSGAMFLGEGFYCDPNVYNGTLSLTNTYGDNTDFDKPGMLSIHGDLVLPDNTLLSNSAQFNCGQIYLRESDTLINSGSLWVSNILNFGFFNNSGTTTIQGSLVNFNSIQNDGTIRVGDWFDNWSNTILGQRSTLQTTNLVNEDNGSIIGPALNGGDEDRLELFANISIQDRSISYGAIDQMILILDQSLQCSGANDGLGIDEIHDPSRFGKSLVFMSSCSSGAATGNCNLLSGLAQLNASGTPSICPTGLQRANLTADFTILLGLNPTPVAANYIWQPGNVAGQNISVQPTSTTVYTVYATYQGCTFSRTVQVYVFPYALPTIQYVSTPSYPPSTVASFAVSNTGNYAGVYSIVPSVPSVTINSATGLISATGISSYGTYTVSFTANMPYPCETYVCRTVIVLKGMSCQLSLPKPNSYALCPGDKISLTPTIVGTGDPAMKELVIWSAPSGSSPLSLSCATCSNSTLTYSGLQDAGIYTVALFSGSFQCATATLSVRPKDFCETEEIIGCCFSNYGAAVYVNKDTYLNIHCNIVNELGYKGSGQAPPNNLNILKGRFTNVSGAHVRVLLDWIHNAKNELYSVYQGTTTLFGADQKLKGNSNTHFNELWLLGNGTKSLWTDEYAHANLDLSSNVLSIQNNNFAMKNPLALIARTTGYAANGVNGYFSWSMAASAIEYLYPLGASANTLAPFRYRPMTITNNQVANTDEISANFMNVPPALTTDPVFTNLNPALVNVISTQAPNVLQINNAFYHKVKNAISTSTTASNLAIKSFYLPVDGQFQSLAEWEKDPSQTLDWWGSTPGASASNAISTNPGTAGMLYAKATGTFSFNYKPFILARGGFYLNTTNFGNTGGNNGTIITVTSNPLSPGFPTPAGGGLSNPYGTGTNSGNTGGGGNTIFTPNPVSGEYVMTITPPGSCSVPGKLRFEIDQNGNITPGSVKYGLAGNSSYLGDLSEALYTIDNQNSGITFSAIPRSLLKSCVNSITVTTTNGSDHILQNNATPSESIYLSLPPFPGTGNTITYGQFVLYNQNAQAVYNTPLSPGINILSPNNLTAGVYRFEFLVSASTAPPLSETITGQLIVK